MRRLLIHIRDDPQGFLKGCAIGGVSAIIGTYLLDAIQHWVATR